jgi:hypothetical protein
MRDGVELLLERERRALAAYERIRCQWAIDETRALIAALNVMAALRDQDPMRVLDMRIAFNEALARFLLSAAAATPPAPADGKPPTSSGPKA